MQRAAIYARYSTDEQRGTSLEDQVRRCREEAHRLGFDVPESLIFSDAAISGTSAAIGKRTGYHALIAAWEARAFAGIVVDEISRLARDALELAKLAWKGPTSASSVQTVWTRPRQTGSYPLESQASSAHISFVRRVIASSAECRANSSEAIRLPTHP